ncbi:hypothetical protein DJ69_13885 [Halorubrum persicum]|uniref:Uncharacterized protein n=1 Tax=Halorubrum persicum TaxID=1383844 RepID=A0A2G1WGB9_9EURY|nr:hypothetical protein [Halorubrum persicum]PHQ38022.1 hypothetical protein DJ69_13885 [Halorubrum persicum]
MRLALFALLALVAVGSLTGGVAAQDNTTAVANATDECTETINEYTAICDAELDGSDVVIDIHTDGPQTVVVTEAFRKGSGELNQRRVSLDEGRNTIRHRVTVDGGSEGVTIAAGQTLYQKEVRSSSTIVAGPFTGSDVQAAGIGGSLGVALTTLYLVARRVYGRTEEPERVA